MSQVARIVRVSVKGAAPYIGARPDPSDPEQRIPAWSRDAAEVMGWLCGAWRARFNQHRSRRSKHGPDGALVPIGRDVNSMSIKEARKAFEVLRAAPDLLLHSTEKIEASEWFAAAKRRATNTTRGLPAGRMPRFKSRKRHDETFACLFNSGKNAVLHRTGRKSGMVVISGMNPVGYRQPGDGARWQVRIHVRLSQPIRPYTSVRINWTKRRLVFVNAPVVVPGKQNTGEIVGVDRGAVHLLATSDGHFYDLPHSDLKALDARVKFHQRRYCKARDTWCHQTGQAAENYQPSRRAQRHLDQAARLRAKAARIVTDTQQKATTDLVCRYDVIVTERLSLRGMTRAGGARKRGLNRVLHAAALARVQDMLTYKTHAAGTSLVEVPAPYTSQRCSACGHTAPENRKTQAAHRCAVCTTSSNADTNAARNILWLHTNNGQGLPARGASVRRARHPQGDRGAAAMKREPPTPALVSTGTGIPAL